MMFLVGNDQLMLRSKWMCCFDWYWVPTPYFRDSLGTGESTDLRSAGKESSRECWVLQSNQKKQSCSSVGNESHGMPDPARPCNPLRGARWFPRVKLHFRFGSFQGAGRHLPCASRGGEERREDRRGPGGATAQRVGPAGFWGCVRRPGDITC